jgi:hypothetical protein
MIMIQREFCNSSYQTTYITNVKKDNDDIYLYMIYMFFIFISIQLTILQRLRTIEQVHITITRVEESSEYEQEVPAEDPRHYS